MKPVIISDHAAARYFERVEAGFDVEEVRKRMLNAIGSQLKAAAATGSTSIPIDGFTYLLEGRTVTTVIDGSRAMTRGNHRQRKRARQVREGETQ
ncbi:MAG: hypothetical protein AAFR65_11190 [Pseudomonadota bacterium]